MAPSYQDLKTFHLPEGTRGRSGFVVAVWQFAQATVFACSPQYAYAWRRWLLRLFGAKVGKASPGAPECPRHLPLVCHLR